MFTAREHIVVCHGCGKFHTLSTEVQGQRSGCNLGGSGAGLRRLQGRTRRGADWSHCAGVR